MTTREYSEDYDDPILAEVYDIHQTYTDDVELILRFIGDSESLNILECFSGTGRMLIPLASAGHRITGIEIAGAMMERAREKLNALDPEIGERVSLLHADIFDTDWGMGFDVVLLGANCFFELSSASDQEECISKAAKALRNGGYLYVDNNDWGGGVNPKNVGSEWKGLEGTCQDGTYARWTGRITDVDESEGVMHFVRTCFIRLPDGKETEVEVPGSKRPIGGDEVESWLVKHGFEILDKFGDRQETPYEKGSSDRAIFWARRV
ncbi:class I SAM-dependent DNA methyltransferase [Candidatus Hydrogenedentota bacterium]